MKQVLRTSFSAVPCTSPLIILFILGDNGFQCCDGALYLIGLGLTELLMWAFTDGLGLFYLLSKAIAAVIVLLWNFFAKKLMYRKKPDKE